MAAHCVLAGLRHDVHVHTYEVSKAALRPLLATYWSSAGWKNPPESPQGVELEQAVSAGIMFTEPTMLDHDGWVDAARTAAAAVTLEGVSEAFVASLETRRLDLRSALGSYAVARHLSEHRFDPTPGQVGCAVCGLPSGPAATDLNILNFERFKWGGVRRDDLRYIAFDLDQFVRAPKAPVTDAAVTLGRQLLDALGSAAPDLTAAAVAGQLKALPGNAQERSVVVDILGVCGVLNTPGHPSHRETFQPLSGRELPDRRFVDQAYPACWWTGAHGLDPAAVQEFLPRLT